MEDRYRKNKELIEEISALKQKINELEHKELERKRDYEAPLESEEYFKAIIRNSTEIVLIVDKLGTIIYASPSVEHFLGYGPDELIGTSSFDWIVSDDKPRAITDFVESLQTKELPIPNVFRVIHKDGTVRILEGIGNNLLDNPIVAGFVMNVRDITERKLMDDALRESEEKYRIHFENASDIVFSYDLEFRILSISPSVERVLGYKPEEFIGKSFAELNMIPPEDLEKSFSDAMRVFAGERLDAISYTFIARDGTRKYGEINSAPFFSNGQVVAVICAARDITERKLAEEALQNNKTQLSEALEIAHLGHWEYDVINDIFTFNDQFYKVFRTTVEKMGGYTMHSAEYAHRFVHPDDIDVVGEETRKAIETTDSNFNRQIEHRILYADGTVGYITVRFFIVKDSHGRTVKTYGVNQDITERKLAEKKLQDTLESLRKSFGTTIQVMVSAVETRDPYTSGHQIRVANIARAIATEMELPQEKIDGIRMAGSIHDIGKLSIPAEILSKPSKLSEIEFSLVKEHARKGYEMIKEVESP